MARLEKLEDFVLCIDTCGFEASLILGKVYRRLPDPEAEQRGLWRIVDEDGEGYLYPQRCFVPIELPEVARKALSTVPRP